VPNPAKKSLGQNFLVERSYQERIVGALEPGPDDVVLEIGPGRGALTRHLLGRVRRLVLVELDDALAAQWQNETAGRADVEVRHQDALTLDLRTIGVAPEHLKVIGNIPYHITSPLLFRLLEPDRRAALIVLMVQREVAGRMLALAGGHEYGALTIGVQTAARCERLFQVPRGAFRPVPNVDSTVVRLTPWRPPLLDLAEAQHLRTLTRAAFGWRRKQLQRILRDAPAYGLTAPQLAELAAAGFEPTARPEALSPDEFIRLTRELRRLGFPRQDTAQPGTSWD
jgi:16S rRNA (adenine1518-N6/adenine1519-N6)-dimethyltransferase